MLVLVYVFAVIGVAALIFLFKAYVLDRISALESRVAKLDNPYRYPIQRYGVNGNYYTPKCTVCTKTIDINLLKEKYSYLDEQIDHLSDRLDSVADEIGGLDNRIDEIEMNKAE